MQVIQKTEQSDIATVYIARSAAGKYIEFVESCQPPLGREEKWVMVISTLYGCPVDCKICDAGGRFQGRLSLEELLFQVDYMISERYPDRVVTSERLKIQFARMGEPAFNLHVIELLEAMPALYEYNTLVPSISTIAPHGCEEFFSRLLEVKKSLYPGEFQLQYSIHSTSESQRDHLIPVRKWDFERMASYGESFFEKGGRKITLNFALSKDSIVEPSILLRYFSPEYFIIKLTPVNPTFKARQNKVESRITKEKTDDALLDEFRSCGYDVILSIGEWEENRIGSNCGQYIQSYMKSCESLPGSYNPGMVMLTE